MENFYIAAICLSKNIGCIRAKELINFFGSGQAVWNVKLDDLKSSPFPQNIINSFIDLRNSHPDCPEELFNYCESKKIKLCSIKDSRYPEILKNIKDAPAAFYYRGELMPDVLRIAIVGTRQPTRYGEVVAMQIAEEISSKGITVVSGAADGIDTAAHIGAIKGGRTIAVLGSGLEAVVSIERQRIINKILENNGLIMSEYAPVLHANKGTFPQRNRIIAGLSIATVVVEAGAKSGALNTAFHAGDYGRYIFVVPNNIYSKKSIGCHELIREGATLVKNAQDILSDCNITIETGIQKAKTIGLQPLEGKEEIVCNLIPKDIGISAEELSMKLDNISSAELSSILLNLEMNNYIESDTLGKYIRLYGNY